MLIDKGLSPNEIVTLKLTSGEELIAKFAEETDNFYKIEKPYVLTATANGIGMIPYLITVSIEKTISINKSTVCVIVPSAKESADQYIQSTTKIKMI